MKSDLGRVFTARQVADYLSLDVNTIRKYYRELGGVRVGAAYRFFERTLTDAILRQTQETTCGANKDKRTVHSKILPHTEGGLQVGDRASSRTSSEDKFNLLN